MAQAVKYRPQVLQALTQSVLHTKMFVQPDGVEPSEPLEWLMTPATNHTDSATEFCGIYAGHLVGGSFGVFGRPCSPEYPCPDGDTSNGWQTGYGGPMSGYACNLTGIVDQGGHRQTIVHYANETLKLDDGDPPLWRNSIYLWNYCDAAWDVFWQHTYREAKRDCSVESCYAWGPILETWGVQSEINELGFEDSILVHDGQESLLGPDETDFVSPASPWILFHREPNRSYGVGNRVVAGVDAIVGRKTWTDGNGHVYAIVEFPEQGWSAAVADLEQLLPGYHLATITSSAEQDFAWQFLVEVTGGGWEWWLGGFQDVEIETDPAEGWKWITGDRWSYTAWRPGEPNDAGGTEDHLAMDGNGWNDEGTALGIIKGYIAELGRFDDVAADYWAFGFIERLAAAGITAGCGNYDYCPTAAVSRAQMAVFLERGMRGSDFVPPPAQGNVFLDVAASDFAASFIEQLYLDGITAGCGKNNYCPDATVSRAQMAVFLLRARYGSGYSPPPATGLFTDVPLSHWAVHWIEQLAREGITSGCGDGIYCPEAAVTRDQMAVFLVRTFGLQ